MGVPGCCVDGVQDDANGLELPCKQLVQESDEFLRRALIGEAGEAADICKKYTKTQEKNAGNPIAAGSPTIV